MPEESAHRRFGKIPAATHRSGIGRSSLYELAAEHEGLFVKFKNSTLVNLQLLDQIIEALPPAKIKAPKKKNATV